MQTTIHHLAEIDPPPRPRPGRRRAHDSSDIESVAPNLVAAEVFAAVHSSNNRKLTKDLRKLALECPDARFRYVFFGAPGFRHERQHKLETLEGIEVWGIDV